MRRLGLLVLDSLFILAWLGFSTIILWIVSSFIYGLTAVTTEWEVLGGYGRQIFWLTAVLWIGLTGLTLVDCYGNSRFDDFKSNLWTRAVLTEFFVVGPTAYYIGSFRRRVLPKVDGSSLLLLKRNRMFFDGLYFLSFWGSITLFATAFAMVVFAYSFESFQLLATLTLLLVPLTTIPTLMLSTVFLLDAVERPRDAWENVNFLKLLNPWSWVFGIRKYYLQVLRPELVAGGARKV